MTVKKINLGPKGGQYFEDFITRVLGDSLEEFAELVAIRKQSTKSKELKIIKRWCSTNGDLVVNQSDFRQALSAVDYSIQEYPCLPVDLVDNLSKNMDYLYSGAWYIYLYVEGLALLRGDLIVKKNSGKGSDAFIRNIMNCIMVYTDSVIPRDGFIEIRLSEQNGRGVLVMFARYINTHGIYMTGKEEVYLRGTYMWNIPSKGFGSGFWFTSRDPIPEGEIQEEFEKKHDQYFTVDQRKGFVLCKFPS